MSKINTDETRVLRDYIEEHEKCYDAELFFIKRGEKIIDGLDNALDEIDRLKEIETWSLKAVKWLNEKDHEMGKTEQRTKEGVWENIQARFHKNDFATLNKIKQAIDSVGETKEECRGQKGLTKMKIRDAARNRHALSGVDSQALEGALSQTESELSRLRMMNDIGKALVGLDERNQIERRTKDACFEVVWPLVTKIAGGFAIKKQVKQAIDSAKIEK